MAEYFPTLTAQSYRPPNGVNNGKQFLNLYVPAGSPPVTGWPVLQITHVTGFVSSIMPPSVNIGIRLLALEAGWAVVDATVTVKGVGVGGGLYWPPNAGLYDIEGNADDTPNSDQAWILMKIRELAPTYDLNTDIILSGGVSAGGVLAAAGTYGPDQQDLGSSIPQINQSSLANGLLHLNSQYWGPGFATTMFSPDQTDNNFLRKASALTQPCIAFGLAVPNHVLSSSPGYFVVLPGAEEHNSATPAYCYGTTAPDFGFAGTISYDFDATTRLPLQTATATLGQVWAHVTWSALMLRKQLNLLSTYHLTHSRLVSGVAFEDVGGMTPDAVFPGVPSALADATLGADMLAWMTTNFTGCGGGTALSMRADWSSVFAAETKLLSTERAQGMSQRRMAQKSVSRWSGRREVRRWRVVWRDASPTEFLNVRDIYRASSGGATGINFTPPDDPTGCVLCRFVHGSFRYTQNGPFSYSLEAELEEMI